MGRNTGWWGRLRGRGLRNGAVGRDENHCRGRAAAADRGDGDLVRGVATELGGRGDGTRLRVDYVGWTALDVVGDQALTCLETELSAL